MGRNLYAADENALLGQGIRTVAELVREPDLTRAAYAPVGFDAVAHGVELKGRLDAWMAARRRRSDATAEWRAALARLAETARDRGGPWLVRLRPRLAIAAMDGRLEALDVPLPKGDVRPDRPQRMLARFRALRPLLPRLRLLLPGEDAEALVDDGEDIAEEFEARADAVVQWEMARKGAVREVQRLRGELVESFRRLDKWAEGAARAGAEAVPGRSRAVLRHHAATRPKGKPKDEDVPDGELDAWIAAEPVGGGESGVEGGERAPEDVEA